MFGSKTPKPPGASAEGSFSLSKAEAERIAILGQAGGSDAPVRRPQGTKPISTPEIKSVRGTILRVDRARVPSGTYVASPAIDEFAIILEDDPCTVYAGLRGSLYAVLRAGDVVALTLTAKTYPPGIFAVTDCQIVSRSA